MNFIFVKQLWGLFNIFRKPKHKLSKVLIPKACSTEIPSEISNAIDIINWADFETAYGNSKRTIPFYLRNIFCKDTEIAMNATHQLWCSLCHQHAFISSAALPSYDILKIGLLKLDDKLKVEILDILQGFSDCTSKQYFVAINRTPSNWEAELRKKLMSDVDIFEELTKHSDELISRFSMIIYKELTLNDKPVTL